MKGIFLLACVVAAVYIIPGAAAIKCYVCAGGDSCKDKYAKPESHTTGGCDYCIKAKTEKNDAAGTDQDAVYRSCGGTGGQHPPMECSKQEAEGVTAIVCYCNEDKCNSATTLRLTGAALLSALAIKFLL